ncbi:MAG: hypothetical protein M3Z75_06555 [Actinomycetota bacterium]|nr:hypothetical protein [Actinomycetota bacterium]
MTTHARQGLLEVISAFFEAERTAGTGQVWLGRAEPDLGHDYDGPELHPGTPEYEAGYREYLAAERCIQPAEEVTHPPHADRSLTNDPYVIHETEPGSRAYITQVWSPAPDEGIQRLHSPMPEPELEPEAEI